MEAMNTSERNVQKKQSRSFAASHSWLSVSKAYNQPAMAGDGRFEQLLKLKLTVEKSERESAQHDLRSESLRLAHRANVNDSQLRLGLIAHCDRSLAEARMVIGKLPRGKMC